jgi:hypothetical protein
MRKRFSYAALALVAAAGIATSAIIYHGSSNNRRSTTEHVETAVTTNGDLVDCGSFKVNNEVSVVSLNATNVSCSVAQGVARAAENDTSGSDTLTINGFICRPTGVSGIACINGTGQITFEVLSNITSTSAPEILGKTVQTTSGKHPSAPKVRGPEVAKGIVTTYHLSAHEKGYKNKRMKFLVSINNHPYYPVHRNFKARLAVGTTILRFRAYDPKGRIGPIYRIIVVKRHRAKRHRGNGGHSVQFNIVRVARTQLGNSYLYGGAAVLGGRTDCSGFVQAVFRSVGIYVPRVAEGQYYAAPIKPSVSQRKVGDLFFYHSPIGHVSIYIGGNRVIADPHTGDVVKIQNMYGSGNIVGVGRYWVHR